MAELLKREFDLLSLKVAMDVSGDAPTVALELQRVVDQQPARVERWTCDATSIGVPAQLDRSAPQYRGDPFRLPGELLSGIKDGVARAGHGQEPLWLHLAKPLGYLNLVPWEQLLQPALDVPILRLPDFLARPPSISVRPLEVTLCVSAPMAKAAFSAAEHVADIARLIAEAAPRKPIVHVFCDAALVEDVQRRVPSGLMEVHIHSPHRASSFAPADRRFDLAESSGRVQNPWLRWMCHTLRGRSIDVVHFLTHGYLWRDRGALAFAESPLENVDRRAARFVGADELLAFYMQIGAWAAAFSSPELNYSEMGLRLLADTIAQSRPGPVLHHELRLDVHKRALDEAYRLLLGRTSTAPRSPALFMYCHPSLLEPAPTDIAFRPEAKETSLMEDLYRTSSNVPAWVGSSQRYLERRRSELQQKRITEPSVNEMLYRQQSADAQVVEDTLQQIENVLGNVLVNKFGGE